MRIHITSEEKGLTLSGLLQERGFQVEQPCGGWQRCGRCRVKVQGGLLPPGETEREFLDEAQLAAGWRLACCALVTGPIDVELPEEAAQPEATAVSRRRVRAGLAIDLGATMIAGRLLDLGSRRVLAESAELNRQRGYGADLMSRIGYGLRRGGEELRQVALAQLDGLAGKLCGQAGLDRDQVREAVIVGNTAMLHLLAGYPLQGLATLPYAPASLFDLESQEILPGLTCYLPPCRSADLGADALAGMLHARLFDPQRKALYLDIGTTCDIALSDGRNVYCCAIPTGPVFEGVCLSCGMAAAPGAVYQVSREKNAVTCLTVGDRPPQGICAAGLISALAMLLEAGALSSKGRLLTGHPLDGYLEGGEGNRRFRLPDAGLYITQNDVRQLQLAKGAVSAGFGQLMRRLGLQYADLDQLLLAGALGAELDRQAATAIGLLPARSAPALRILGNAALEGAALLLDNKLARADLRSLARRCQSLELTDSDEFQLASFRRMALEPVY